MGEVQIEFLQQLSSLIAHNKSINADISRRKGISVMVESPSDEFSLAVFLMQNWMNLFFGIIGIAGTIFGYVSWRLAKKSTAAYSLLFELADRHIDKSLTDKKLSDTKDQLKEEANRIRELQSKIQHEIPIEARRTVLKDKLETNVEQMHEVYTSLQKVRKQLLKLGDEANIPYEIKSAIDTEIQPKYLAKRRKSDLRNYLTIITAAAAISSALLPYPFSRVASWLILGILGVPVTLLLVKSSWKEWRTQFRETANPLLVKYLALIGFGFIMVGTASFPLYEGLLRYYIYIHDDFILTFSLMTFVVGIITIAVKCVIVARNWWLTSKSTEPTLKNF